MAQHAIFKYSRAIIAFLIVVGSFSILFILALRPIPPENKDILNIAAGLVLGVLSTVASYYFGSSKDKSDSDQNTREQGTTIIQPQPPTQEVIEQVKDVMKSEHELIKEWAAAEGWTYNGTAWTKPGEADKTPDELNKLYKAGKA